MKPCIEERHVRFVDEPSLGLSDADFVHRMWDEDETAILTGGEDSDDEEEEEEESKEDGSGSEDEDVTNST